MHFVHLSPWFYGMSTIFDKRGCGRGYAPRAFNTREVPRMVSGKGARNVSTEEHEDEMSCLHGSRWLSYWLRENGGKSLEPPRG